MANRNGIVNYKELKTDLKKLTQTAPKTVIEKTLNDVKIRGPVWIAAGVSDHYNVKKAEITGGKIGKVKIKGGSIETLMLQYTGRRLTPTHFGMSPQAPKDGAGSYTSKATIIKGQKKTLGKVKKLTKKQRANIGRNFTKQGQRNSPQSPWMLHSTGAKSADKVQYIPFQRREQPGKLDHVFKSVSLPQMIRKGKDGPLQPTVDARLNEGIEKRFNHYADRYLGK